MKNNSYGCISIIIEVILMGVFVTVCGYALEEGDSFSFYTCLFFVALIGVLIFTTVKSRGNDEKPAAPAPNSFEIKINEETFNEIKNTVSSINRFHVYLLTDGFYNWLSQRDIEESDEQDVFKLANSMILSDIKTALVGMGCSVDMKSREGLVLILTSAALNSHDEVEFAKLKLITDDSVKPAEDLINEAYNIFNSEKNPDKLVFADLLKKYNRDIHLQYLIVLYRFLSLAAKADRVVTEQEAAYLGGLLKRAQEINPEVDTAKDVLPVLYDVNAHLQNRPTDKAEELDSLIGLESVKKEVRTMTNFIKIQKKREERGLKTSPLSYHCVFTGNPGTGKTTVARIIAGIYKELGILQSGHLVETDRSGLVAEYIGQTAAKTNEVIDSALDGVLFIDEAYALLGGTEGDYGKEAIATLLKRMEDDRDRLVVILAGYTNEMKDFINSNPGLKSRFSRYIEFPDYSVDELEQIFEFNMRKYEYLFGAGAKQVLQQRLKEAVARKDANFGNGRFVRNIFEKAVERQANRLASENKLTTERLSTLEKEDII
jgi:AAA+ superfamily predicted ATPase